jgi:hypothetical protein
MADEAQRAKLLLAVLAIARFGARGLGEEADALVVANHLRRDTRRLGGLTDVHARLRLVVK